MTDSKTEKINLFKELKQDYCQPKTPRRVNIAAALYLAAEGSGAPGDDSFQACIGGLYGMAYTIKFACKEAGRDFVVGKLEGLYDLTAPPSGDCKWRMLIRVPEFVTEKDLAAARTSLTEKGKEGDFAAVVLEQIEEDDCVQMLHLGPYDQEGETVAQMDSYCKVEGLTPHRWHHEIYLSDPRRVPAEKLKTILRRPVA